MVHCGRNTVTKYLNGDHESLCRKNFRSGMDQFYDYIISKLSAGTSRKDLLKELTELEMVTRTRCGRCNKSLLTAKMM